MDHSNFHIRDELKYQIDRVNNEQQQSMTSGQTPTPWSPQAAQASARTTSRFEKIQTPWSTGNETTPSVASSTVPTPQTTTSGQQLQMPAQSQQYITMPSYEAQQQQTSTLDKFKDWARNTGDAMQAAAVGYTTGATLGNFDEAMGATAAVTGNPNNYAMGRDAVRQLQNDLQQRHPYIYGGAEFVGAMTTPMHLFKDTTFANKVRNAFTDTLNASAGYANNWNDFATNLVANGAANMVGLTGEKLPFWRAVGSTGKKIVKQGINSFADNVKNIFYNEEDKEKFR
ncbi:MAG: hypothetical protein J6Y91_04960 [Alphaproteobacteria bacterium]|nr:hypothetical protein [Alphaproteobacteria bacterium]